MDVWGGARDATGAAEDEEQQWEQQESGKDALVVLVDVRPAMFQPCPRGSDDASPSASTWFQAVVDLLAHLTKSKVIANDNSLLSVVFFGSVRSPALWGVSYTGHWCGCWC